MNRVPHLVAPFATGWDFDFPPLHRKPGDSSEPSSFKFRTIHQTMPLSRRSRWLLFALILYLTLCTMGGIYLADGTLHPALRPLTENEASEFRQSAHTIDAESTDTSITTPDGAVLRGWIVHPHRPNGDAILLLHGLGSSTLDWAPQTSPVW